MSSRNDRHNFQYDFLSLLYWTLFFNFHVWKYWIAYTLLFSVREHYLRPSNDSQDHHSIITHTHTQQVYRRRQTIREAPDRRGPNCIREKTNPQLHYEKTGDKLTNRQTNKQTEERRHRICDRRFNNHRTMPSPAIIVFPCTQRY